MAHGHGMRALSLSTEYRAWFPFPRPAMAWKRPVRGDERKEDCTTTTTREARELTLGTNGARRGLPSEGGGAEGCRRAE
jgi:hypothetical protein